MVCNASNSNKKKQLLYNNRVKLLPTPPPSPPSGQWINVGNCKMQKCIEKGVIYKFSILLGECHTGF